MNWISANLTKIAMIGVAMMIVLALLFLHQCSESRTTQANSDLANGHIDAVTNTAIDAAQTGATRRQDEANNSEIVGETKDAIHNAHDGAAVDDAALSGLRRVRR